MGSYLCDPEDNQDEEESVQRTREYGDRFHVFDAMPSSRDPTIKILLSLIRRLVIQATLEFDADDFDAITKHLASTLGITSMEDILDHFQFNREWWHQRVRCYPPTAEKGAKNIAFVREHVQCNEQLKGGWSKSLETYFDNVEEMYRQGKLEECYDVSLYQWNGTDKCGLSLWLRRRGSNRSENMHQKMRVAFGPHGVGAEVGHYLLLLVTCRYNLSSGIRRKGNHNFGMMRTDLIDRIQIRMVQIFGEDPFPSRNNQCLFKPIKGFVAVGVGPLNYDSKYVEEGDPDKNLVGDMKFLAERMKLRGPPLHVCTHHERKIFNECLKTHRKPTARSWDELASLYKVQADYKTVFPKLPSMLRTHHTKWKVNQELAMVKDTIKVGYYDILKKLGTPSMQTLIDNPAADFQKRSSTQSREEGTPMETTEERIAEVRESAPADPLPVGPGAAPDQTRYVALVDGRSTKVRTCGAAAFGCPNLSKECSGRRGSRDPSKKSHELCRLVQNGSLKLPSSLDEIEKLRKVYRNARQAKRAAERRREKRKEA